MLYWSDLTSRGRRVLCTASLFLVADTALADWSLNMRPGVTPISHKVYDLHMVVLSICATVAVLVFGVMIYSIIHHRKSRAP